MYLVIFIISSLVWYTIIVFFFSDFLKQLMFNVRIEKSFYSNNKYF